MIDPIDAKSLVRELEDLRERVRRLETGWTQQPFAVPMSFNGSPDEKAVIASDTNWRDVAIGNAIVTAQYLHYMFLVDDSNYSGGSIPKARIISTTNEPSGFDNNTSATIEAASSPGGNSHFYQGTIDLYDLAGDAIRGKEAWLTMQMSVDVAGGGSDTYDLALYGGFTIRANPAGAYTGLITGG